MNLITLVENIWDNRTTIDVEPKELWHDDFFKKKWFTDSENDSKYVSKSPGWYWIGCNIEYEELKTLIPTDPKKLPRNACSIKTLTEENLSIFGSQNLCSLNEQNCLIIYNGHQAGTIGRIREHFMLNNENTGALGLKYYPLSNRKWTLSYFTEKHIDKLDANLQQQVKNLVKKKSGRVAIESTWRARFGWPVLCKE